MTEKFWSWSLARYKIDGVEPLLLRLQDEFDFNVNILLWACWCGENFDAAPDIVFRKAVDITAKWSGNVTAPLRNARRFLKAPPPQANAEEAAALRTEIKTLELTAEKVEQTLLESLALSALTPTNEEQDQTLSRMRRNLAVYASLLGAAKNKDFSVSLLESLADLIFNGAEASSAGED